VLLPVLTSILLAACHLSGAEQKFQASEIAGRNSDLMICDLDGDGLEDLVLMDETNFSIFYQDRTQGFTREPQQTYHLEHRPCMVWVAKLGRAAGSLLVMNSDGLAEISFTNRSGPPDIRQIIRQRTVVPEAAGGDNVKRLSLSVQTGREWPLLLVPTKDGLQVWQHQDEWRQAQVLGQAVVTSLRPSLPTSGYTTSVGFDFCVGDVNGDGRDDLIIRSNKTGRTNTYTLYLQQTNGLFALEPALVYADKAEPNSWLCWADLNHDGKVDLIRSVWLNEPSFLPGQPSGKVVVATYLADQHAGIPTEPQQVFRKSDWMAALPVVDLDGDGFMDLVLGYSVMDTREGVRKEVTAKQLDYSLKFYFYRPGAGFPKEADGQRDVIIHLDELDLLSIWGREQYFQRYVKLGGDFGGRGKTDLLVRDQSDDISVYFFLSREKGFSLKPDLRFSCPEQIDEWEAKDLNHDGVSDLIVKLGRTNAYRIFISQK